MDSSFDLHGMTASEAQVALRNYLSTAQARYPRGLERSLDVFDEGSIDAAPQITLALRRLGELYDAQGNTAKAIEYYARFVNLWRDADPELQPMVRRAQQRLNALRPDRG